MKLLGGTASGAIANLAAQGVPFLLLLFVTPILLRSLGREVYGALILFNLIPQIAGQLDLGLSTAATRGFAQYSARADRQKAVRLFREASMLLTVWGLLLGAGFYLFHRSIGSALRLDAVVGAQGLVYLSAAINIPLALANSAMLVPLRALERYGRVAQIQVTGGVIYWIVCTFLATRGATLTQLVMLGTLSLALTTIAQFLAARESGTLSSESPPLPPEASNITYASAAIPAGRLLLRPFLALGAGAFVAQASSLATYHADKLLVAALISPAAAGAYAICASVANKILLVIAACATYTFPRATRMQAQGDLAAVASVFAIATRLSMVLATCIAVPLIALAPTFLEVWIGRDFANEHGLTLQLLALGYTIAASSVVASNVAVGIGEVRMPATFAVIGGVTTLLAVVLLAPRYGAAGAAGAAAIGMTQAMVFNDLLARRLGPIARHASWALLWRLMMIGLPVGILAAVSSALVRGWISLVVIGAAAASSFMLLWLSTFGRGYESVVIRRILYRAGWASNDH